MAARVFVIVYFSSFLLPRVLYYISGFLEQSKEPHSSNISTINPGTRLDSTLNSTQKYSYMRALHAATDVWTARARSAYS